MLSGLPYAKDTPSVILSFVIPEADRTGRMNGMIRAGMYASILLKESKLQHF